MGRKDETVGLITDLSPQELPAQAWLQANRQGWGIENGTHQRLDVSLNDDRCRVRSTNGLWILGMLRRLAISLYTHWREQQPNPRSLCSPTSKRPWAKIIWPRLCAFVTCKRPTPLKSLHAYALGGPGRMTEIFKSGNLLFFCCNSIYVCRYFHHESFQFSTSSLLEQIAQIQSMERGKLSVIKESASGPFYKLQARENGKNLTRYIPREQVPAVQAGH